MEREKKFVTLFCHKIQNVHLIKDVGMVPYTFKKSFGFNANLVAFKNKEDDYSYLKSEVKGLKLSFIKRGLKIPFLSVYLSAVSYLIKNSKIIDVLNLYHFSFSTLIYGYIYKKTNPKGRLYIKLDMRPGLLKENFKPQKKFKVLNIIKLKSRLYFVKHILDIASYENITTLDELQETIPKYSFKFIHIPNGLSPENMEKIIAFEDKENIIITVGRIGSNQKDNQRLLNAISKINLKNWKVYFIGPIEEKFQKNIEDYFEENKHHKNKVIFTGSIIDRKELFSYYNKAKVFCLTSNFEGFALVFPEALYARNYIITTPVGGSIDITNNGKVGCIINTNQELYSKLVDIITNNIDLEANYNLAKEYSQNFIWSRIFLKEKRSFNV